MVKASKKVKVEKDAKFWMSMFILVLMVLSIAGFAMMSGGGASSSQNGVPSEVPFQQFEQDGQVFWGAIKNSEQFIFFDIDGYNEAFIEKSLANKIKAQTGDVEIYVDDGFTNSNAKFLIEKGLRGLNLNYVYLNEPVCNANTLIFTVNESFSLDGDCMYFLSTNEDAADKADVVLYHLVQ